MPDISMCTNVHCPSKEYCFRFTAIPGMRQSFSDFTCEDDEVNCSYFYPNGKDSLKCKRNGVKREGEICNLEYCTYPKCIQENYCSKCHKLDGVHKISCPTKKLNL